MKRDVVGNTSNVLWVVMGTVGLVMLIACANVTNLLLVRAESRQQELSIRAALGARLMIRTFQALRNVDPGFRDPDHLETLRTSIPPSLVVEPVRVTRMQQEIVRKLATIPGVSSVAFVNQMPMEDFGSDWDEIPAESNALIGKRLPLRPFKYVSPGLFHTAGTRILAGRELSWQDIYAGRHIVLIPENLARELWGTPAAAIGKRLREFDSMPWYEVVGVVQNTRENGPNKEPPAIVYWPPLMSYLFGKKETAAVRTVTFVVRSGRSGSLSFVHELQQTVWSVDANLPVASVRTMRDVYDRSLSRTSFTLMMLTIAAAMALVLGVIGIYGVISYAVSQRRREIGIRLALGAQQRELKTMFVRSGLTLAFIGLGIGLIASLGVTRLMKSLLFGITPLDPFTYIAVPIILGLAAMLASYFPARRAARVDPVEALRAE